MKFLGFYMNHFINLGPIMKQGNNDVLGGRISQFAINENVSTGRFILTSDLAYSIIIHLILFFLLINLAPSIYKHSSKQTITAISAQLFYKKKEVVSIVDPINNIEIQTTNEVINEAPPTDIPSMNKGLIKQVINKPITEKLTKQIDPYRSLKSLRENINSEINHQNSEQAYEDYVASKNFIPRSTTKFNELPEVKAVKIEVDCNNPVNKSIRVISGLLGGSIKCNSFNGSQKFIDARLEKLGKKKAKQ